MRPDLPPIPPGIEADPSNSGNYGHSYSQAAYRPVLPPVPFGIKQDTSNTHPGLVSPRPQRPAGGAVDTTVTVGLERAASSLAVAQAQSASNNNTTANMVTPGNARVANWVASTNGPPPPAQHMPNNGFAASYASGPSISRSGSPYGQHQQQQGPPPRLSVNGNHYAGAQQQQQYPIASQYASVQQHPGPPIASQHPPRASSMYTTSSQPCPSQQQYQQQAPLHHSFSDMTLRGPSGSSSSKSQHPRASSYSTSALDPAAAAGYRNSSPAPSAHSQSRRSSSVGVTPQDPALASAASLCIALPSQADLGQQKSDAAYSQDPAAARVAWAKAVLKFVERHQASSSSGEFSKITDPVLVKWTDEAIRLIISSADIVNPGPVPEALYLRGELSGSGKFPSYRSKDLSMAFRDFEAAANLNYHAAWAKIALAYETFGEQNKSQADFERAKKAYEEGVRRSEVTCTYRIAMAHLLGQLGFQPNANVAVPLLKTAASLATADDPLPAYIYGMLLSGELDLGSSITSSIPSHLLLDEVGRTQDPRPWIERSAYLGYAPAQFKMGFNYEYATMGCGYDPLLSVQYYSLASQQGDIEADMALSKWFLCGSEAFDLQESLAFTFAEKAAKKGLPSAEFALGYYHEIGIGNRKDLEASKKWYMKAANHGNTDAAGRLAALNVNVGNVMDRTQHEAQMNDKIVRRRTQAKFDADKRKAASSAPEQLPPPMPSSPTPMPVPQRPSSSLSASSGPGGATARPRKGSAVTPTPQSSYPYPSGGSQMPLAPPVLPTTDSNTSLRRRETLRQVEQQAAEYSRRSSQYSASATGTPTASPGPSGAPHTRTGRDRDGSNSLGPPSNSGLQRYSLVDSGPVPSGASAVSSNSSGSANSGVSMVKASQGPQTFEAMGLKTGRVKAEQECIIS